MHNKLKFDRRRQHAKHCPCGKNNKDGKFVPYEGYADKGYCHSCAQTFLPEKVTSCELRVAGSASRRKTTRNPIPATLNSIPQPQTIPITIFKASHRRPLENNLVQYLISRFGWKITKELVTRYFIGTSKHWPGATVFWQIDVDGNIRDGKIMLYDKLTGKRCRTGAQHATWVHSVLQLQNFELQQCLFGEHLINLPEHRDKTVALVESEKTALVASIYYPQYVWLACGGSGGLKADRVAVLKERAVVLFPDTDAYDLWKLAAQEYNFHIFSILDERAPIEDKHAKLDLADYLLQYDYREFLNQHTPPAPPEPEPQPEATPGEELTFPDVLDMQQALHQIEYCGVTVPWDIWNLFWKIYDNRNDADSWRKLVQFVGMN